MYVKITASQGKKFPYSIGDLKSDNPDTSFPANLSEKTLAEFDVYVVTEVPAPVIDSKTHRQTQDVQIINGVWTQVWTVQQLSQVDASANVRAYRASLLSECDWTQVSDSPVDKTAWATYRQALRDISKQPEFPWNVVWPVSP